MGDRREQAALSDLALGQADTLRVSDVMRLLHLSKNTVYKMVREKTLPSYRVGRQIRFRYDDIMASVSASEMGRGRSEPARPTGGSDPTNGERLAGGRDASYALMRQERHSAMGSLPGEVDEGRGRVTSLPDVADGVPSWMQGSLVIGGQGLANDTYASYLGELGVKALRANVNCYLSLARLYLGTVHATTVGLWSEEEARYNIPFVRDMLPGMSVIVFHLLKRRVGFTLPRRGAPDVRRWSDLLSEDVRIANRERGAESRVLLDEKLEYMEARGQDVRGYDQVVTSEFAQALMVSRGIANVAVTGERPSRLIDDLVFLPMQSEVVDLVIAKGPKTRSMVAATRSLLRTEAFRREFDPTVYDVSRMGDVVFES